MAYRIEVIPSAALKREAMVPEHREAMDRALELLVSGDDPIPWMASRTGIEKSFYSLYLTRNVEIEYTVYEELRLVIVAAVIWDPIDPDCISLTDQ